MIQNTWLTIALYPGCIQGFFLWYLLRQKQDSNRAAIGYLNALLLTISILMLLRVTYQPAFFRLFAEIILLPDVILFLTGPFIYLFTRALLQLDALSGQRLWFHFIPAILHVAVVNTFLGLHLTGYLHYLNGAQILWAFHLIEASAMLSIGIYLALSMRDYQRYKSAFYQKYAAPFIGQFLRYFFIIGFVLLVVWLSGWLVKLCRHQSDYSIYTIFWVLLVAAIYFLAYKLLSTPAILELPKILEPSLEFTEDAVIDPNEVQVVAQFMLEEKPYLNQELKIADLAEGLNMPKHQLSRIINQGFGKTFFDYVNDYRVQAFIEARSDQKQAHLNTMELAYAVGFNSKSAFNRAFLKVTGKSPRSFFGQQL